MSRADSHHTTNPVSLIRDPFVRAALPRQGVRRLSARRSRSQQGCRMKFVTSNPLAHPDVVARKLVEIANTAGPSPWTLVTVSDS